jgi:hypothetical protein
VTEHADMNALIRQAAGRDPAPSRTRATTSTVEQPVGRIGIGYGGAGMTSRTDERDELNDRIRTAAKLVSGRMSINDVIGSTGAYNG